MTKQPSSKSATTSSLSPAEISKQIKSLLKDVPESRADATRLDTLRRLFTQLEMEGEISFGTPVPQNTVAAKWYSFLHRSHQTMVSQLCERIQLGRQSHASIRCMWGVIAGSPQTYHKGSLCPSSYKVLNPQLLQQWMTAMAQQETHTMDRGMKHMLQAEFFAPFRDVQFFSLGCITTLATEAYENDNQLDNNADDMEKDETYNNSRPVRTELFSQKLLELLMMIPVPASQDEIDQHSQYLFTPPQNVNPRKNAATVATADSSEEKNKDKEEEPSDDPTSSSEDEDDDEDDNDDDDSDDPTDDRNESTRPNKRLKREQPYRCTYQRMGAFRREYLRAWLAVLRLPLPVASLKQALQFLPQNVLQYVAHPLRFSDFFVQAYSVYEGLIGVLALDGLFLLITEYELEYPNFYKQLYKLISSKVLYAKYRTKFFLLLTNCLTRNEMLPAHLVAAFIKRMCRCALSGPVSGVLFVLALVSNLLRKHPECSCLIQRKAGLEMDDLFLPEEDDPVQCRALQSSLWELAVLERHYYPAVATLATSIGRIQEDKSPMHVVDDFVSHTYSSLFSQEKKHKSKTALTFQCPTSLFTNDDVFAGCVMIGSSVVE